MRNFNQDYHRAQTYKDIIVPKQNIDIEIGCGVGLHPILYTKKNTHRNLIAIEHTAEKFKKFYRRYLNHESPENLFPVHANAISFITSQIKDSTVKNIFILYPNPNPLNKHRNKRFHNMPFMKVLIDKLADDGEIVIVSNESFYIKEAMDIMQNIWGLKLKSKTNLLEVCDFKPRTHFEIKYLKKQENCYELVFCH